MNYLYVKDNQIVSKGNLKNFSDGVDNIEVSDEIFENYERYVFKNGKIELDENYDKKLYEAVKKQRKEEILLQLKELDMKTIRALRAKEEDRIAQYELMAEKLRKEAGNL